MSSKENLSSFHVRRSNREISIIFFLILLANQFNISYGDIMLTTPNSGGVSKVLIYYGNELDPAEWGEMCAQNIQPPEKSVATVICKQYGHKDGNFYSLPRWVGLVLWSHTGMCGSLEGVWLVEKFHVAAIGGNMTGLNWFVSLRLLLAMVTIF